MSFRVQELYLTCRHAYLPLFIKSAQVPIFADKLKLSRKVHNNSTEMWQFCVSLRVSNLVWSSFKN